MVSCGQRKPYEVESKSEQELKTLCQKIETKRMDTPYWQMLHARLVRRAATTDSQLQFFGDSITAAMDPNLEPFTRNFPSLRPQPFGIGGDVSQELLWRMNNGEMGGKPKIVSILIGTNDIVDNQSDKRIDELVTNIEHIIQTVRVRAPGAKILLTGIFPRGSLYPRDKKVKPRLEAIRKVNERLALLDNKKDIHFVDIGNAFLLNGDVNPALLPDRLHPGRAGYEIWADAIKSTIERMSR